MEYTIKVNETKNKDGNVKGFATVVFGDSFKITNIAILENTEKQQLFVSMPRYRTNARDEHNASIYKDLCNPITKEFREELYGNILEAFKKGKENRVQESPSAEMPEFTVSVTTYEKEGSNIKGLARIFFENSFVVNNVTILQGKNDVFVAMPSYKTKQTDTNNRAVYQDVCYPVTKEFREKLYNSILEEYQKEKAKQQKRATYDGRERNHTAHSKNSR